MKEDISGNNVEVNRKSDRVMAIMQTFGKEGLRLTCTYGPQSGRTDTKKIRLYDEIASE